MKNNKTVTAAMIAIGDELLSGRTKDKNIAHLATFLDVKGIELREVRIISDDRAAIVDAVNNLRKTHDYLFTSGGIGPTHDDITSDAIAHAFDVSIDYHPGAFALLKDHYDSRNIEYTTARKKMARIPDGAELIENLVSVAPGFKIENVYVMAGVPAVFNAMILAIEPGLVVGEKLHSVSIDCNLGEGAIGDALSRIAEQNPQTSIGSYPRFHDDCYSTQIVIRSQSKEALARVVTAVENMLREHNNG